MLSFLKDRKVGKGKKDYLRGKIREIITEELKNCGINERIDDISKSLKSVDKKMEDLKSSIAPLSRSKTDSIRKLKMKRMVIEILNQNKRMTASDLSVRLNLSRTRCSEYLTELEKAGVMKGVVISRQKFYELENQPNELSDS